MRNESKILMEMIKQMLCQANKEKINTKPLVQSDSEVIVEKLGKVGFLIS